MKVRTSLMAASFVTASVTAALAAPYTFQTVTIPNGPVSDVTGINDVGQISGNYVGTNPSGNGFIETLATSTVSTFAQFGFYTHAESINNNGLSIGSTLESGGTRGIVRDPVSGSLTLLRLFVPFPLGYSTTGINDAGQIVGYMPAGYHGSEADAGFLYDPATNTSSTLIDPATGTTNGYMTPSSTVGYTHPNDINNRGQVVGGTLTATSPSTTIPTGFLLDLATNTYTSIDVPGSTSTVAYGINDLGQIVGTYQNGLVTNGFLLDLSTGTYTTLSDPGARSTAAYGINNAGQIVGSFIDGNGNEEGFLATPDAVAATVPEPTSMALLGGDIGVLAWVRRRRRPACRPRVVRGRSLIFFAGSRSVSATEAIGATCSSNRMWA